MATHRCIYIYFSLSLTETFTKIVYIYIYIYIDLNLYLAKNEAKDLDLSHPQTCRGRTISCWAWRLCATYAQAPDLTSSRILTNSGIFNDF